MERKAFPREFRKHSRFFSANFENQELAADFAEKKLSDCYYQICTFYKKYILNKATVEEASKANYEELFGVIEGALEDVASAGSYDKLSLYNGVFMLIYDQRDDLVQVGFDESTVLAMFDEVYSSAEALTVRKDQAEKLKQEIIDHYVQYREAIERAYDNAAERS